MNSPPFPPIAPNFVYDSSVLLEQNAQYRSDNLQLQQQVQQLSAQTTDLQRQLQLSYGPVQISLMKRDFARLNKIAGVLDRQNLALEKTIESLRAQLSALSAKNGQLEEENRQLRDQKAWLEEENRQRQEPNRFLPSPPLPNFSTENATFFIP